MDYGATSPHHSGIGGTSVADFINYAGKTLHLTIFLQKKCLPVSFGK